MPIEVHKHGGVSIYGQKAIAYFRVASMASALSLEIRGLRLRRGFSAYAMAKREFGLKGSREKVLIQLREIVDRMSAGVTRIVHEE